MDLGIMLASVLQVVSTAPDQIAAGVQTASVSGALDTAKDTGFASLFAHNMTNIVHAAWGGDRRKPAPGWVLLVCAFLFGILGVGVALWMKGVNPLDPQAIATALGLGVTAGGPGAIATNVV